jgi:soluble cytochrome b562
MTCFRTGTYCLIERTDLIQPGYLHMAINSEQAAIKALRRRYPSESYALFPQLADKTGAGPNRFADAAVMGLWPSRGLLFEGFEVKVSKSDLRKELRTPEKAETIAKYCDKWWLVLGSQDLMDGVGLIPEKWGVLAPKDGTQELKVVQQATKQKAEDFDREFMASVFRRAQEDIVEGKLESDSDVWDEAYNQGYSEGYDEAFQKGKKRRQKQSDRIEELKEIIEVFENKTGINLKDDDPFSQWDYPFEDIAKAVRVVLEGDVKKHIDEVKNIRDRAKSLYKTINQELESGIYGSSDKSLDNEEFEK